MRVVVAVFVVCAVACAAAHVAILRSVVSRRSAVSPDVPRPRLAVELLWALLPAVILALVLTATWDRIRDESKAKPGVLMRIAR